MLTIDRNLLSTVIEELVGIDPDNIFEVNITPEEIKVEVRVPGTGSVRERILPPKHLSPNQDEIYTAIVTIHVVDNPQQEEGPDPRLATPEDYDNEQHKAQEVALDFLWPDLDDDDEDLEF